mmetsp:Transcript_41108/g.113287  ORF Transcript_41108/g.113287 Transcript_41108/m.113287 type:complete len:817 (-) Transcript_41108:157-2607(-)
MDEDDDDIDLGAAEANDPLDAENFNPVDYINKQFPNESSLAGLDGFVDRLKAQQRNIDEDIRKAVRRQASCGRRARADLDEARAAVGELFGRIKAIQAKAEQSDALVSDVCRDIKSLDIAKRNLTLTVTALKRLVMLVQALEQLRTLTMSRRYREASGLIVAIEELAGHFQELSHVARVADLLERKAAILSELRSQLLEDFASLHKPEHERQAGVEDAAYCVDAMGASVQRDVITEFCLQLLEGYKDIYQPPKASSGLEMAERRYKWLKTTLAEFNEKYAAHFPEHWRVPCGLCEHFCHVTRQHLVEVLSILHHVADPELMVRVLRRSIDFENELARKYPPDDSPDTSPSQAVLDYAHAGGPSGFGFRYPDVLGKPSAKKATSSRAAEREQFAPRFRGIISECFDAYLGSWVQHEEKQLLEALDKASASGADKFVSQDDSYDDDDEGNLAPKVIYASAPDLFANMKGSMTKCAGFSTHQTLFDLFQVFRKVLAQYADRLEGQLPRKVSQGLSPDTVQAVCCVIGTSEYCYETLPQLAEKLTETIDSAFEDRVTFAGEQEHLRNAMSRANQVLVQSISANLDEAFSKMTRTNWAQFSQEVGDNSPFVGEISERLSTQLEPMAKNLSKIHFQFFCRKFVQAFVARFVNEIYKCRKISEQGAQQLLLDTSFIKNALQQAPVTAQGGNRPMSTVYSNYVLKEMGRAENMLKVLSSPDIDASAVGAMLGGEGSATDIERLLALRATSDGDVSTMMPSSLDEEASSGVAAIRNTMMSLGATLNHNTNKTQEEMKKNLGGLQKKFQGLGVNLPGMSRKTASGT